jgi:uncharacterized protein YcnI
MRSPSRAAMLAAILATALAPSAHAHVTLNPNEGPANQYFRAALRIPHGCKASPTVAVRVQLPEGVLSVKPQAKPGWTITITKRTLATPIQGDHGTTITETIDVIEWRGGPLADAHFDEFGLAMKLPAALKTTLWFPTVQECAEGVHRWIEIPAHGQKWGDLKEPAPFVRITEPPAKGGH